MSAPTPPSRLRAVRRFRFAGVADAEAGGAARQRAHHVGGGESARGLAAAADQGAGALDLRARPRRRIDAEQSPSGGEQRVAIVGQHDAAIGHLARFVGLKSALQEVGAPPIRWAALPAS